MPMPAELDDVVEVSSYDRREDVRVIVNLPARYMLANKRNLKGDRCEFACRIVNVSLDAGVKPLTNRTTKFPFNVSAAPSTLSNTSYVVPWTVPPILKDKFDGD